VSAEGASAHRVLESDASESIALVRSQLGLFIPGPVANDFKAEHLKNLSLLAEPGDVYGALQRANRSEITPGEAKLVSQFCALYEQQKTPDEKHR
jgi:hypothetical protein